MHTWCLQIVCIIAHEGKERASHYLAAEYPEGSQHFLFGASQQAKHKMCGFVHIWPWQKHARPAHKEDANNSRVLTDENQLQVLSKGCLSPSVPNVLIFACLWQLQLSRPKRFTQLPEGLQTGNPIQTSNTMGDVTGGTAWHKHDVGLYSFEF